MSTLYMHIGTPKTGTTAMQEFFELNGETLRKFGISYPLMKQKVVADNRNGHFLSTREYDEDLDKRNWSIVESELEKYDKVLLSDEAIYRTGGYLTEFWRMLKKRTERTGSTLKAIVYVRKQDDFFWSYYIQSIRHRQRILRLRESVLRDWVYLPYWNYYKYVKRIESVIGRENMIVRVYEKEQWKSGSVIDDMLEAIGVSPEQAKYLEYRQNRSNPGLGDLAVAAKRYWNQVFFEKRTDLQYRSCANLQNNVNQILSEKGMFKKRTGMTADVRKKILKRYRHCNEKLAREYFGRKDLFFDKTIDRGDTEDIFSREELEYVYNLWVDGIDEYPEYGFNSQQMRVLCDEALKLYDRGENYRFSRIKHLIRYVQRVRRIMHEQEFRGSILARFWQCE